MDMAVREFVDESGRRWRAWSVTAADIHPAIRTADYVSAIYQTGWLVFETVRRDEKRRLAFFPQRWADASDDDLRTLLGRAEIVPGRRTDSERPTVAHSEPAPTPQAEIPESEEADIAADPQLVRTFRYPGGRYWTATVIVRPEDSHQVLRFTAGARIIDLGSWPKHWADYAEDQLVELLRWAAPRGGAGPSSPGIPRRRWDDPPERTTQ
jgi:hypothetical protein